MKAKLNQLLERFQRSHHGVLQDPKAYSNWLAQTYYFVCHSVPLLGYALPYLRHDELGKRFTAHMREEHNHERLALNDMNHMQATLSDYPELFATQAMYQSQYYRIQFEDPTSFLGYILFLEAIATTWAKTEYDLIKPKYPRAATFLKVHAEEDPDHVEKALEAILSLSAEKQEKVWQNLLYTHDMYEKILLEISQTKRSERAA